MRSHALKASSCQISLHEMSNGSVTRNQNLVGILLGLAAFTVWACGDAITKAAGQSNLPFFQVIFLSALVGQFLITIPCIFSGQLARLRPRNTKIFFFQCIINILISIVNIYTFTLIPLTTVYCAVFTSPLIISFLAWWFMKEPLGPKRAIFLMISFSGALIAINPWSIELQESTAEAWILLPCFPILFSIMVLLTRVLQKTNTPEAIATIPLLARTAFFLPLAIYVWEPMSASQIVYVIMIGLTLAAGLFLLTKALAKAPSTIVSPLHYTQLVSGAILGYLFWNDVPAWHMIAGSVIIVVTGVAGVRQNAVSKPVEA